MWSWMVWVGCRAKNCPLEHWSWREPIYEPNNSWSTILSCSIWSPELATSGILQVFLFVHDVLCIRFTWFISMNWDSLLLAALFTATFKIRWSLPVRTCWQGLYELIPSFPLCAKAFKHEFILSDTLAWTQTYCFYILLPSHEDRTQSRESCRVRVRARSFCHVFPWLFKLQNWSRLRTIPQQSSPVWLHKFRIFRICTDKTWYFGCHQATGSGEDSCVCRLTPTLFCHSLSYAERKLWMLLNTWGCFMLFL